ncbi:MAG: DUF6455 family protein [Aestuariivita sp.]|uniref:DUF6455 family protein n=1 Tax=Aestuariivita sp. TaxID=1872407 RepID=UPI003BAEA24C
MGWISKIANSADLASGMMERLGSDFAQDIINNPETGTRKYASVVMRCSGCSDQDGCAKLQAENDHLDHAPSYCRNADVLERKLRA